jgi:hypothetical protein
MDLNRAIRQAMELTALTMDLTEECAVAEERLHTTAPPHLVDADNRLTPLDHECEALVGQIHAYNMSIAELQREMAGSKGELDEWLGRTESNSMADNMQIHVRVGTANVSAVGLGDLRISSPSFSAFQAKKSLADAEICEMRALIHVLENKLWQSGVRIIYPTKKAALYHSAREADKGFATWISGYSALAGRYREKWWAELENVGWLKKASIFHARRERIRLEYEAILEVEREK